MAGEQVERSVLLRLKLLPDDGNKAAADTVRDEAMTLVEDIAAGYALVRESAISEAGKAAAGQVAAAKKAAKDIQAVMAEAGRAIASPGTKLQGATVVSPGKGATATGTATVGGGGKSAAAKQAEKDAADAEKAFDREAAAAAKAYSRIMRERDRNAADAQKKAEKARADAEKAYDAEAAAAVRAYGRIIREREKLQSTIQTQTAAQRQFQDQAVKSAAEGLNSVVKIGRGFAEVGLLSEETTEAMLKGLIRIQAGFDIITGGVDAYVKLTEYVRHTTKALEAQAAAQAALNALQVTGARTGAASATAAAAGGAGRAIGAAGAGVAGGGAAVAAGGGGFGAAAAGLVAFVAPLAAIAAVVVGAAAGLNELVIYLGKLAGFDWDFLGVSLKGLWGDSAKAKASDKNASSKEKERENLVAGINRRNDASTEADELSRTLSAWNEKLQSAARDAAGLEGSNRDNAERADIIAAIAAAKGQVGTESAKREQDKAAFRGDARAGEDLARTRLVEETDKLLSVDQKRVQTLREQHKTQEQQVKTLREQLTQADKLVAQEKAQYQSALAKLGALTKAEQLRAQEIAKKSQSGQAVDESDARFLQSIGIGTKKADEFFAKKAQGLGGDATLSGLGEGSDKLVEAENARRDVAKQLADAETGLSQTTSSLDEAMAALKDTITQLAAAVNASLKFSNENKGKAGEAAPTVQLPASGQQAAPANQITAATKQQAEQIREIGDAAAESQRQLSEAFVAALSKIETENAAAIDALRSRQTRGALTAQSGSVS